MIQIFATPVVRLRHRETMGRPLNMRCCAKSSIVVERLDPKPLNMRRADLVQVEANQVVAGIFILALGTLYLEI